MRVADYRQLRVYQLAFETAMEIFVLSKKFPGEEKYTLTDQLRRSSRSVCANIAEAWRKRRYEAAFVSKLSDSDTEAAETEVHLDFAFHCGYLDSRMHNTLQDRYDHICRQLRNMMHDTPSWCGNDSELHEFPSEYFVGSDAPKDLVSTDKRKSLNRSPRSQRLPRP